MSIGRRNLNGLAAMAAAGAALGLRPGAARAQQFPDRPIRMVVPYAAGGFSDIVARGVAQRLAERLGGSQVIIDNRTGAGGAIGTEAVVRAPADGYTILFHSAAVAIEPSTRRDLSYDVRRDLAPVTQVAETPFAFAVHPSVPARSIAELIAYAKANPRKLNFGSPGMGSSVHLSIEYFRALAGIEIVHVPYRGANPALTALQTNEVQLVFDALSSLRPVVDAGRARALAVGTPRRASLWPELPTVQESGLPGYEINIWHGLFAPAATPAPIIRRLNEAVRAAMATEEMRAWATRLGFQVAVAEPEAFRAFFTREIDHWANIVQRTGVRIE